MDMLGKYILDAKGEPVRERSLFKWGQWLEAESQKPQRGLIRVGWTKIGGGFVSTVFLSLDHRFYGDSNRTPILWETMVHNGKEWGEQERCGGSREQAEAMHARMVEKVKAAQPRRRRRTSAK